MELEITGTNLDGDGTGRIDGRPIAVPGTIPGERVEVRLQGSRGRGDRVELVRIVTASPHRVTPPCRHFGPCGGCAWQHIAYPEQLRLKQRLLQRLVDEAREPGSRRPPPVRETLPTPVPAVPEGRDPAATAAPPTPWRYRNKVAFVFGPGGRGQPVIMGHYRRGSRTIVPVAECPVHADGGNDLAFALRDALRRAGIPGASPDGEDGIARHVVARVAEGRAERLGTLVVTANVKALRRVTAEMQKVLLGGDDSARQGSAGFHLNVHDRPGSMLFGRETRRLFGLETLRERVAGVSYLVSPTTFFQTNVRAAGVLVAQVLDALPADGFDRVLDLYAGVGLFALPLAAQGRQVTAVEENRQAVASAEAAVRLNRIDPRSLRLIPARVEDTEPRVRAVAWDAVVLDPPRQGCPPQVLEWVFRGLRPRRVVYVSCNPETLARDLASESVRGFAVERIQPVDMFPHTAHIESVAVFER